MEHTKFCSCDGCEAMRVQRDHERATIRIDGKEIRGTPFGKSWIESMHETLVDLNATIASALAMNEQYLAGEPQPSPRSVSDGSKWIDALCAEIEQKGGPRHG
jgi:hypothetical protein